MHGTSLGGMVATFLSNHRKIDFLCADRTFSNVSDVSGISFGVYCKFLFLILCDWDTNSGYYYFNSNTYKVIKRVRKTYKN